MKSLVQTVVFAALLLIGNVVLAAPMSAECLNWKSEAGEPKGDVVEFMITDKIVAMQERGGPLTTPRVVGSELEKSPVVYSIITLLNDKAVIVFIFDLTNGTGVITWLNFETSKMKKVSSATAIVSVQCSFDMK